MIDKCKVQEIVTKFLEDKEYELITLSISADNKILVEVDSFAGVDLDFCTSLSNYIQDNLNRDEEDYELTCSSVCLTDPFKTRMQYEKNLGNEVEVLTTDGQKLYGTLVSVDEDSFTVDAEVMVPKTVGKGKMKVVKTLVFAYSNVKYCKYNLKV